jgi:hypothetical protein
MVFRILGYGVLLFGGAIFLMFLASLVGHMH